MLHYIAQQHATSFVFTSRPILHWKAAPEPKYPAVPGITGMYDILVTKKLGKIVVSYRDTCFSGEYTVIHNYKYDPKQQLANPSPYEPVEFSAEKQRQLTEQHTRFIKQDTPIYTVPNFLQLLRPVKDWDQPNFTLLLMMLGMFFPTTGMQHQQLMDTIRICIL